MKPNVLTTMIAGKILKRSPSRASGHTSTDLRAKDDFIAGVSFFFYCHCKVDGAALYINQPMECVGSIDGNINTHCAS